MRAMAPLQTYSVSKKAIVPRRYSEAASSERAAEAKRPPVCLYLETTNRCNLLCTTCPRTYEELEPPADMSWELFTSIGSAARSSPHGAARRRRADVGQEPSAHGALPQGPRRLRAVQHEWNGAQRAQRPGAD